MIYKIDVIFNRMNEFYFEYVKKKIFEQNLEKARIYFNSSNGILSAFKILNIPFDESNVGKSKFFKSNCRRRILCSRKTIKPKSKTLYKKY